jgi:hypothetical protein
MLVYDFQNVGKIKNLKNNQYVEPKHGAAIEGIPNTILGDFKYQQYKMIPPNRNESMKTMTELIKLSQTPSDDEFTLEMDKVKKSFKSLCEEIGVDFPKDMVEELKDACGSIILDLKYHFNRPRPYKLAPLYNIELDTNEIEDTTFDSPSYPSGHATQATLIGNYLANKYPLHRGKFLKLSRDIAKSRVIAKVHYPSDVQMGEMIGNDMFRYLKEKGLI